MNTYSHRGDGRPTKVDKLPKSNGSTDGPTTVVDQMIVASDPDTLTTLASMYECEHTI